MKKKDEKLLHFFFQLILFYPIDTKNILDIHKYLIKLTLSNQKCMTQHTLINLHPDKYNQEFHYYAFAVKLDRCVGRCNAFNDFSNKECVPNEAEDLNLSVFDLITGINELKARTRHISCECKFTFSGKNVIQINGGITLNVDLSVKNVIYVNKIMFGILLHVVVKMENI